MHDDERAAGLHALARTFLRQHPEEATRHLDNFPVPEIVLANLDPRMAKTERDPERVKVIERMRDHNRLPETRDFPSWKAERRAWFTSPEELIEEEWMLPNGDHFRIVAQPLRFWPMSYTTTPDTGSLRQLLIDNAPISGDGPYLGLRASYFAEGEQELYLKAGIWSWSAGYDLMIDDQHEWRNAVQTFGNHRAGLVGGDEWRARGGPVGGSPGRRRGARPPAKPSRRQLQAMPMC